MPEEGNNPETPEQETELSTEQEVSSVDEGTAEVTPPAMPEAEVVVIETTPTEEAPPSEPEVVPTSEESQPAEAPAEETPAEEQVEEPVAAPAAEAEASAEAETEVAAEAETEVVAEAEASTEAVAEVESSAEAETEVAVEEAAEGEAVPVADFPDPASDNKDAITFLEEIIGDAENFDAVIDKASPNELALLLERIAGHDEIGEFITKVGLIKKGFDQKTEDESMEQTLKERFSTALARFNKKRVAYYETREKEKDENSVAKYALLERLKVIVQEEQVTKIQEVRDIQKSWREIGWVLQKDVQPLKETYKQYLDFYYNLRGKYQELLEMDREYNLKGKEEIIQKIEALIPGEDGTREIWKTHSQQVKDLQVEWRAAGHVPREKVDEINSSYRNVLDRFYEMRSGYYEIQDAQKGENAEKKKALLEQLRLYADFKSDRAKNWNDATKAVLELQENWKEIGPGPIEENKKLWKEYRSLCDNFFSAKGKFFKGFDTIRNDNLKLKTDICEKAEEISISDDFKEGASILKDLQKDWKSIGPVHERYSNKIWKRFRKACDHFFDRRSKALDSERSGFQENLENKEKLILELQTLTAADDAAGRVDEFNEIQTRWKNTGHVPFKLKDKINNAFKEAIGKYFNKTKIRRGNSRGGGGGGGINKESLGNMSEDARFRKLDGEIRRLQSKIRIVQEKVDQYDTNIQFISKGKSGDPLRNQIQAQIDSEKSRIDSMKAKVKELRKLRDNPPEENVEEPIQEEAAPVAAAVEAVATPSDAPEKEKATETDSPAESLEAAASEEE